MQMFESVVMACDQWTLDGANAIRSSLELFRLRVHFYLCVQQQNVIDLLAGDIPGSDYVVLCSHGIDTELLDVSSPDTMKAGFAVVDQIEGEWKTVWFALTPTNVAQYVHLSGRTVLSTGCGSGKDLMARAFLESGCRAYIGPIEGADQDSVALFTIGFFYHLLAQRHDPGLPGMGDEEAVERARAMDSYSCAGTHRFRYYGV